MSVRRLRTWVGVMAWLAVVPAWGQTQTEEGFANILQKAQELSQAGKWAEAAPLWDRIVAINPTAPEYWLRLATARIQLKEYRAAIPAYVKAFELGAGYPANSAYNVACCHALLGEKDEALHWLEVALKKGFRDLRQAQTDNDLASLRDDPRYRDMVMLVDVSKLSRDEGWRHDLRVLAREIKRMHFDPYRRVTREEFDAQVQRLYEEIPRLSENQVMARFVAIAALAGDGHTHVRPSGQIGMAPIQMFAFTDGVFITAAAPAHAELAGAQVLKVGVHSVEDALRMLDPVISRDNAMGIKAAGPARLVFPALLNGLGMVPESDKLPLTIRDAKGQERAVTVPTTPVDLNTVSNKPKEDWVTARKDAKLTAPLYLKNRTAAYWFEYLPDQKTVYCQYNAVRNEPNESLEKFAGRLFKFIDDNDVTRLVLDVRWNGGGNSFLNRPMVHGMLRCDKINQPGKLFVIIGRDTFSAAQNFTTDVEMHTHAIFVGEPSGASPNFIGESVRFNLPYSKMTGTISDLHWVRSWPMDYRTWIAPRLYAPPSFAFYKENRDPALEAILAYGK